VKNAKPTEQEIIAQVVRIPGPERGLAVMTNSSRDLALATIVMCRAIAADAELGPTAGAYAHALARALVDGRDPRAVFRNLGGV
jgi:hypothetical protein